MNNNENATVEARAESASAEYDDTGLARAHDRLPNEMVNEMVADNTLSALIVGCNGRMGRMLMNKARSNGVPAIGIDLPLDDDKLCTSCKNINAVILCVPAIHLEETVCRLVPHLPRNAILADITSVKEVPLRIMEKHWSGPVVGTHPLFGPAAISPDERPIAIIAGKTASEQHVRLITGLFQRLDCKTFETTAERHDKAMAKIQNMNFITNLAYFALIAEEKELLPFLTPSFERRKAAAAKMLTEDADMFSGLFETNEHSHEAVRQYRRMLNVAASGDIELLCKRAQWWWHGYQAQKENSQPTITLDNLSGKTAS